MNSAAVVLGDSFGDDCCYDWGAVAADNVPDRTSLANEEIGRQSAGGRGQQSQEMG